MLQEEKNKIISESMKATRERRKNQVCRVYKVKVDYSRLSKQQKEDFKLLFLEAKWLSNDIIAYSKKEGNSIFDYHITDNIVRLDKDKNPINYTLTKIGSQMKQSVLDQLKSNVKTLATLKKNGYEVGPIKFRTKVVSINLKQYGSTYRIIGSNKMKLQNIKGTIIVNGLKQIIDNPDIECANAKILNLPTGYFIAITTYIDKDKLERIDNGKIIGIDFGCSTSFITSESDKIDIKLGESERLKRLQAKLSRQKKGSKRYNRTRHLINVEYQKLKYKKLDAANKLVHRFKQYHTIVIQDEQLEAWKSNGHGKSVQHSILGTVKRKLLELDNIVIISKTAPTTKLCTCCGNRNEKIELKDRVFVCPVCGYTEDRDIHAANNMVWMYQHNVGVGRTDFTREQIDSQVAKALGIDSQREGITTI